MSRFQCDVTYQLTIGGDYVHIAFTAKIRLKSFVLSLASSKLR